jgi:hypothetical protein
MLIPKAIVGEQKEKSKALGRAAGPEGTPPPAQDPCSTGTGKGQKLSPQDI